MEADIFVVVFVIIFVLGDLSCVLFLGGESGNTEQKNTTSPLRAGGSGLSSECLK